MVPSFIYHSEEAQNTLSTFLKRRVPIVGMMSDQGEVSNKIDRVISDYHDITVDVILFTRVRLHATDYTSKQRFIVTLEIAIYSCQGNPFPTKFLHC